MGGLVARSSVGHPPRSPCCGWYGLAAPGAGESTAQILAAHPNLTEASIRAALAFAARALRADVVYPVSP